MSNVLSILRLGLLFINYIICIVVCRNTYVLEDISVVVLIGLSILVFLGSVVCLYRCININIGYNCIYAVLITILVFDKNIKLSDVTMFFVLLTVILITIFCWYLYIYENKIQKIISKGGDIEEIRDAYKKQMIYLLIVLVLVWIFLAVMYYALQSISARIITYLCSINAIFSIPAMIGFLLIMLISIFVFVVYMLE